jgi:hypothetical protein
MFDSIKGHPISGADIATTLGGLFKKDELWLLSDIETLSDAQAGERATVLGDLWRGTRQAPIAISTGDLCFALDQASQIVSLDIHLESDPNVQLLVEDGLRVLP